MTTTTDKGKSLGEKLCDAVDDYNGEPVGSLWQMLNEDDRAGQERIALAFVASLSDQVPCECGADDQCEMAARAEAAETRALAMEEALKVAEAKADMRADSNYLAGVQAGFNAAQDPNPNKALAAIQNAYQGHIGEYRALSTEAQS